MEKPKKKWEKVRGTGGRGTKEGGHSGLLTENSQRAAKVELPRNQRDAGGRAERSSDTEVKETIKLLALQKENAPHPPLTQILEKKRKVKSKGGPV